MKEKAKKIFRIFIGQLMGVACDAALIHNFIRKDQSPMAGWNLYCERYIKLFTFISWLMAISVGILAVHLGIGASKEDYRKKHAEALKKSAESMKPKLWTTLWRWIECFPMILFAAIFAGNFHLAFVWTLWSVFAMSTESSAKKLNEIFATPTPTTFSGVMEELSKKASQN